MHHWDFCLIFPAPNIDPPTTSPFQKQTFVRAEGAGGRGSVATKSVGAKFGEQLRDLRARIDATAPHYIRCLKPNDELLPDEFDPKQIVEQLRYSGVLEAVRVSRAGYPTRYPHGVFMSRYYMLGDLGQDGTKRNKDMIQLTKFIARHVWEAEIKQQATRAAVAEAQKFANVKVSSCPANALFKPQSPPPQLSHMSYFSQSTNATTYRVRPPTSGNVLKAPKSRRRRNV